jgi:hypothetical protein
VPNVQPRLNLNSQPIVETGTCNNQAQEIATSHEQEQEIPPSEQVFDIVVDPGLRKPIDEYDVNIRDAVRREYLLQGPCQLIGHIYLKKMGYRQRSFHDSWFKNHNWLKYSVTKDVGFCFYCYLFKQQISLCQTCWIQPLLEVAQEVVEVS